MNFIVANLKKKKKNTHKNPLNGQFRNVVIFLAVQHKKRPGSGRGRAPIPSASPEPSLLSSPCRGRILRGAPEQPAPPGSGGERADHISNDFLTNSAAHCLFSFTNCSTPAI